jgi:hypothetical protein
MLPIGVCYLVPYCPIWGHDAVRLVERKKFINVGLSKYVEFWKQGIEQNATYEDKSICGLLGGYFIAFVKTFAYSRVQYFGRLFCFQ